MQGIVPIHGCVSDADCQNDFASLPLSLPRLANSVFCANLGGDKTYALKKNEFASLPRFLSRGYAAPSMNSTKEHEGWNDLFPWRSLVFFVEACQNLPQGYAIVS